MALESQREQWWTGAALCHRSLEFWPQRLRRKVRGRSPATDLPTGQYNVGGTGECAGRVHGGPLLGSPSLAHSSSCGVVEPAARHQCLCFVCVVWAPPLHLIVLLPIPPPPPPDSVGDRHHGLVNQPIQCGGTGECAGRMRKPLARIAGRLRSCGTQWPPTFFVWARSVRCVPHVCTSVLLHFTCYAPPPPPDPIIPDATHPTCLSALPTTPVYRSRACRGATVGPSVADLCTLGDLPTCGIFVSCVPPVVP